MACPARGLNSVSVMELLGVTGAIAALVTGLSSSPHCAAMCGPLACAVGGAARRGPPAIAWQLGRLGAYATVGALAGGLGRGLVSFSPPLLRALPWLMAAGLLLGAFDVAAWFRGPGSAIPAAGRLWRRLTAPLAKFSPTARSAAFGALTPLLPCGLLYGVLLAAAASGTVLGGAAVMGAFVLGTAPALGLVQASAGRLGRSNRAVWARRVVLIAAAGVLVYRGWHAPQAGAPPDCHPESVQQAGDR